MTGPLVPSTTLGHAKDQIDSENLMAFPSERAGGCDAEESVF